MVISAELLRDVLGDIDRLFDGDGCVYLIGETSHVAEGWRDWTTQIEFYADVDASRFEDLQEAVANVSSGRGVIVNNEFPGDLIPLPQGYQNRARDISPEFKPGDMRLLVRHFDPYSVAYRFIARGDEPDYHIVLMYLDKGWITFEEMDDRLEKLLPEFSLETIAQDPAEFRRKYRGLRQMWRKQLRPRTVHRPTVT